MPSQRSALDFARDAAQISLLDQEQPQLRYVTPEIASTSLPYKEPPEGTKVWHRRNGALLLTVTPGVTVDEDDKTVEFKLPYGSVPRMEIAWMCTQAVLTKSPLLELPPAMAEFMRALGINAGTGGKKGSIIRVREQTERLLRANLTLEQRGHPDLDHGAKLVIASSWKMWWSDARPPEKTYIRLSDDFFRLAIGAPVPISLHALQLFQTHPVQMDLYWWLTYRFSYLDKPTLVTWDQLMEQFGFQLARGPQGKHQFRKAIVDALAKVKAVYQQANVEVTKHGLLLKPSPPHISFRGLRALSRS